MAASRIQSSLGLYRHLVRRVKLLPSLDMQNYYKHKIRQEYNSYSDENDPDRIQQIIHKAVEDAEYIVNKYTEKQ